MEKFVSDDEDTGIDLGNFKGKSAMKKFAETSLGHWVTLKDGRTALHLETDLPIIRVFVPGEKELECLHLNEVTGVLEEALPATR